MVEIKCVCVLRGVEERPIYTSGGRFPANAHMEGDQETWGVTPPRNAPG